MGSKFINTDRLTGTKGVTKTGKIMSGVCHSHFEGHKGFPAKRKLTTREQGNVDKLVAGTHKLVNGFIVKL